MRYKIKKIAKRNNLKYDVVEYWAAKVFKSRLIVSKLFL